MVGCDDQPGAGDGQTGREGMAERPVVSDEAGVMLVEGRGLGSRQTLKVERERRLGNLATPSNLQKLQTALHAKAKAEPEFRFYALYDRFTARIFWRMPTLAAVPTRGQQGWTARACLLYTSDAADE